MHPSALLAIGLALLAAAAPNAEPGKKTRTKTITTTTQPTTTTAATPKPTKEICAGGNLNGFLIQCDTSVFHDQYTNFKNQAAVDARTIPACIQACANTANCCGGNFDTFTDDILNIPGCRLLIKPANQGCGVAATYDFTHGGIANDIAGFFHIE